MLAVIGCGLHVCRSYLRSVTMSEYATLFSCEHTGATPALASKRAVVVKLRPPAVLALGERMRVKIQGPPTGSCTVLSSTVGPAITEAGNAWESASVEALTWDGEASATAESAQELYSDPIEPAYDGSVSLCVAFTFDEGSRLSFAAKVSDDVVTFFKDGVEAVDGVYPDASLARGAGYSPLAGFSVGLVAVEVSTGFSGDPALIYDPPAVTAGGASGAVVAEFSVQGVSGAPVYTLTNDAGGLFTLSGDTLYSTAGPYTAGYYDVEVTVSGVTPALPVTGVRVMVVS